jgi:hypothetical protein
MARFASGGSSKSLKKLVFDKPRCHFARHGQCPTLIGAGLVCPWGTFPRSLTLPRSTAGGGDELEEFFCAEGPTSLTGVYFHRRAGSLTRTRTRTESRMSSKSARKSARKSVVKTTGKSIFMPGTPEHKRRLDVWQATFFGQVVSTEDYLTIDPNCGVAKVSILPGAQVIGATAHGTLEATVLARVIEHGGPMPHTLHKLQGDGIYMVVRFAEGKRIEGWFSVNDGHIFYSLTAPDFQTMMLDALVSNTKEN